MSNPLARRFLHFTTWFIFILGASVMTVGVMVHDSAPVVAQTPENTATDPAVDPAVDPSAERPVVVPKKNTINLSDNSSSASLFERLISLLGVAVFIALAFAISNNRKAVNWKLVGFGVLMQFVFAAIIFFVPYGDVVFGYVTAAFNRLLEFTNAGSEFIFASYVSGKWEPMLVNFAFATLPTIIFFSSLMTILYYLGIMQIIVRFFANIMQKLLKVSGAEALSVSANIFVGQTEAPLVVKPYIERMTNSELNTVMTGGFATVAGGVMAVYIGMLQTTFPDIAGHLLAASVMSAPAALVVSKIIFPETEVPETASTKTKLDEEKLDANVLDAASRGAAEGLRLALNVGAMLLAFTALIAMANHLLGLLQFWTEHPLSFQEITGYIFWPVAWVMGVPTADCLEIGRLLGVKMFINELVAYQDLAALLNRPDGHQLSPRAITIATYALCGFANFGSIGIQLGGLGGMAPSRKGDLAKIAFKAMLGGTIAALMTATIAGILV